MKQQDVAVLIIIVFFAAIGAFFLSSKFINTDSNKQKAETVSKISSDFTVPDTKIFNSDAINPTARIEVVPNTNNQPFADQQ